MKRFNTFFEDLQSSFYDTTFYKTAHTRGFGRAFFNLFMLSAFVGLGVVVVFIITMFPEARYDNVKQEALKFYPDELEITIASGTLSTNVEEPYSVKTDIFGNTEINEIENILVIDTSADIVEDDIRSANTIVFATDDRIIVSDPSTAESDIFYLEGVPDIIIDEPYLEETFEALRTVYNVLLFVVPLAVFIFITLFVVLQYLFLALFGAMVVQIIGRMKNITYVYGEAYVLSLFALLPILIYDTITDIINVGNNFWIGTLIFLVILWANIESNEDLSVDKNDQ